MKRSWLYIFPLICWLVCSCNSKHVNNRFTLWRNDKIPYGTWYAYQQLDHIFPGSSVDVNKRSPDNSNITEFTKSGVSIHDYSSGQKKAAYIVITPSMKPGEAELNALFRYISEGNHVFISAVDIGKNLMDSLHLSVSDESGFYNFSDSLSVELQHPVTGEINTYSYPGLAFDNYFDGYDSSITTVLGYNAFGKPNFVKFNYEGGGSIFLQVAPATYTNFFLLHKPDNDQYYSQSLSYLPQDLGKVYWDDYFRYHTNGKPRDAKNSFSKLGIFLNDEILKWPLWLVLVLFGILYLFESKRKQRLVPVRVPLRNTSLDFVKTIGRLYYQRRDNKDLSSKMVAHFLDHVRNKYNMPASLANPEFNKRLAFKSGYGLTAVDDLLYSIRYIQDQPEITDEELMNFHHKLDKFYKHL